jgi:hypothetical protein
MTPTHQWFYKMPPHINRVFIPSQTLVLTTAKSTLAVHLDGDPSLIYFPFPCLAHSNSVGVLSVLLADRPALKIVGPRLANCICC